MYEYLDRQPQVGDVVEYIGECSQKGRLPDSKIVIVTSVIDDKVYFTNLSGESDWMSGNYIWKVIKTKPGSEAKVGDTIIRIADGVDPIGTTHTVYRNFGEGASKNSVYYTYSCSIPHTDVLVLCKATKQTSNPFKVGDRVRCISNPNSSRKIGDEFTVVKVHNDDVYYKDGFAAYYKYFELVSRISGESTKVESTNQTTKEQPMTIQQLLQTLFGAEKPTTDYDKRPTILVVAYNRDGSQMGQAIADNIDQVKAKVADTPELWGCKVLTYALDQEVSVDVPVKATKATVITPLAKPEM